MERTCSRCHQGVPEESCYCPTCGLPQLVYSHEEGIAPLAPNRWNDAVRDAGAIEWKSALRPALLLGIPAGLLSSDRSPVSYLCLFWMAAAAAWAVTLYVRRQRPTWITIGAGARIGLVTGLFGGWFAFAISGVSLFAARFLFGKGNEIDEPLQAFVAQFSQQSQAAGSDPQTSAVAKQVAALLLSPEGRAGCMLLAMILIVCGLLLFATAGGAIGARLVAKRSSGAE